MWSPPLVENWDFKGKTFLGCLNTVFSECRSEWKLLLEFCLMRSWTSAQTGYRLVGTFLDCAPHGKNRSLPCKGIGISPEQRVVGNVFPMGRQGAEPELSTSTCTHTLASQFFFVAQWGGQQRGHCTLAGPVMAYCVTAGAHWRPQNHHSNGRGCI